MKSNAAVLHGVGLPWRIEEIDVSPPKPREVTVQLAASGICHSDDHGAKGVRPGPIPIVGGHEGAGVVIGVGSEVTRAGVGDHVVLSPMTACGACRWCIEGKSYLCDNNAYIETGRSPDGSYRFHLNGEGVAALGQLGTFSQYLTVSETQVVSIDDDIPLHVACLLGCGVSAGYGSAVNAARVQPGDVTVVVGVGGVGINAVQGARIAGASLVIAVDPVAFKRASALSFGATHTAATVAEAIPMVSGLTRNVMADKVIVAVGLLEGDSFADLNILTAKGGTICVTSVGRQSEMSLFLPINQFFHSAKSMVGNVAGSTTPLTDWPKMLNLYRTGALKLDELITNEYKLHQINEAVSDMLAGNNIRGVIRF